VGIYLAIAAGGALGAIARYWMISAVTTLAGVGPDGMRFPWGTLAVNVLGSLLAGLLYVWLIERSSLGAEWRALLLVGLLGAFTTFSTFSLDALQLLLGGRPAQALGYMLASVLLCVLLAWVGVQAGRLILSTTG
jgi:fluoride exporter